MAPDMRDNGWTICSTAMEKSSGPMAAFMKVNTLLERSTARAFTHGTMAHGTTESGKRTKSKVLALTLGSMEDSTKASGSIITWMAWESTHGKMAVNIVESTKTIKSTGMASTHGQMAEPTRDTGAEANSMVSAHMLSQVNLSSSVCGKKERELSGSSKIRLTKSQWASLTIRCTLERQKVDSMWINSQRLTSLKSSTNALAELLKSSEQRIAKAYSNSSNSRQANLSLDKTKNMHTDSL